MVFGVGEGLGVGVGLGVGDGVAVGVGVGLDVTFSGRVVSALPASIRNETSPPMSTDVRSR